MILRLLSPLMPFSPLTSLLLVLATLLMTQCKRPHTLPPESPAPKAKLETQWDFGAEAYQHTANIVSFGPRPIESEGHAKTLKYLKEQLAKSGWKTIEQSTKLPTPYGKRRFTNLIARYPNATGAFSSPKGLLAAHYDSKILDHFVGADDAASACGALLEIAAHLPSISSDKASKIEIIFFDGEEAIGENIELNKDGLYGSIFYSRALVNDLANQQQLYQTRPNFGILLDLIGHKNLSVKIPKSSPKDLAALYHHSVGRHGWEKHFGKSEHDALDDHIPVTYIARVPMIDLLGDFSASDWWHTTKDNMDLISKDSLAMTIQVTMDMLLSALQ